MKKFISALFTIVISFAILPFGHAGAELADGKYSLPYQVNKAGSTSASISNDYFIKPATLVKKDGAMYVQLTLKDSKKFVKFESPSGGNKVVANDKANDRRTVQFNISSTSAKQTVNVRVEIPEENYYHNYKIDFVWFADKAKLIEAYAKPAVTKPAADTAKQEAAKKAEAEKKAAAEKAAAEKAKADEKAKAEVEAAKKAEEAKKAEQAKADEEVKNAEATKEAANKAEAEVDEKVEKVAAATEANTDTKATTTAATEAETANTATSDAKEKSQGGATGWIIGLIAVLLVAGAGLLMFRKRKTA